MTRLLALSVLLAASSVLAQPAPPVPIPIPTSTDAGCLIQSDFRSGIGGNHHNFETVILQDHDLVHYWRDNGNVAEGWVRGQVITSQATGPGCIIQSDFRSGDHGNFEVVVPEGNNLVHYFHDNGDVASPWRRGQVISTASTGTGSIIESDFRSAEHGNFEVVVLEGRNLVHYFHDNGNVANPWRQAHVISTAATSAGSNRAPDGGPLVQIRASRVWFGARPSGTITCVSRRVCAIRPHRTTARRRLGG